MLVAVEAEQPRLRQLRHVDRETLGVQEHRLLHERQRPAHLLRIEPARDRDLAGFLLDARREPLCLAASQEEGRALGADLAAR
ncbi:hypothetical protein P9209_23510 [Prescottella defluvii]|nr:hypothetical protein P9209_23510 [Prescottella defluvii]